MEGAEKERKKGKKIYITETWTVPQIRLSTSIISTLGNSVHETGSYVIHTRF